MDLNGFLKTIFEHDLIFTLKFSKNIEDDESGGSTDGGSDGEKSAEDYAITFMDESDKSYNFLLTFFFYF